MRFTPSFMVSALLAGALIAHGCSTVSSASMTPEAVEVERTLGGAVRIDTSGTPRRAFIGSPLVRADALEEALRTSILAAGLFDEVAESSAPDRVLMVEVERLETPKVGLDQTCEAVLRWRLTSGDRSRTIWEELITTRETITTFDELDSELRSERAVHQALKSNLRRGIAKLSEAG